MESAARTRARPPSFPGRTPPPSSFPAGKDPGPRAPRRPAPPPASGPSLPNGRPLGSMGVRAPAAPQGLGQTQRGTVCRTLRGLRSSLDTTKSSHEGSWLSPRPAVGAPPVSTVGGPYTSPSLQGRYYPRAGGSPLRGLADPLTSRHCPRLHGRLSRTTVLERRSRALPRRTRAEGVAADERSALATAVILQASEDWARRRYRDMASLEALTQKSRLAQRRTHGRIGHDDRLPER